MYETSFYVHKMVSKLTFLTLWCAHVRVSVSGGKKYVHFSEDFAHVLNHRFFLEISSSKNILHPFWGRPPLKIPRRSGIFIVKFQQISHMLPLFQLFTLNRQVFYGNRQTHIPSLQKKTLQALIRHLPAFCSRFVLWRNLFRGIFSF